MKSNQKGSLKQETLIDKVNDAYREIQQIAAEVKERQRQVWEKLAGDQLDKIIQNPSSTEKFLYNTDPNLRQAALYILKDLWGFNQQIANTLEKMALEDSDETVQSLALLYLATYYKGSRDGRIGKLLANVVVNESLSTNVRITAYFGLFGIRGLPSEAWPRAWSPGFCFPADVNWSFVNSFLESDC